MSTILDTHQDPNYEPSHAEIVEYGKWLGMEIPEDDHLLWIAREGLKAPLPENWKACKSEKGELYYFNFKTGQSIWDHPLDDHYKKLFKQEKANPSAKSKTAKADDALKVSTPRPASEKEAAPTKQPNAHQKSNQSTSQQSTAEGAASDAPPSAASVAPKTSSSSLPPSGKSQTSKKDAAVKDVAASLPALQKGGATPSASSGSDDERPAHDGPKLGKLRELKTLKTKKDMPGELRLDTLPPANLKPASDPPLITPSSWDTKTPLGSAQEKTKQQPQGIITSTPASVTPSPATEEISVGAATTATTTTAAAATRSNSRESKRRLVSFSNEDIAIAQDGRREIEAEMTAELDRFRLAEQERVQRLKADHAKTLEESLRAARGVASRNHEEAVMTMEAEFKAELQRKKTLISQQTEDEIVRHRRAEEDRMTQRIQATKEDIHSHLEFAIRNLRDVGVEGGNRFIDAVRVEQTAFVAAIADGMRMVEENLSEDVKVLRSTLQAEKQLIQTRIRELQAECNAKVAVMKMENASTIDALTKEFEEQKTTVQAEHEEELRRLVEELRMSAESDLRNVKEEYHHRLASHRNTADANNSSLNDDSTKPLTQFSNPTLEAKGNPQRDVSPRQGLLDAIAAAEHSSDESASGSLLELAHSLHAATQTSTPAAAGPSASAAASRGLTLNEKDLAMSSTTLSKTLPHEDLRCVITEVLRELFKNSPFILPSPASTSDSAQASPTFMFGREIERNVPPPQQGKVSSPSSTHSQHLPSQQHAVALNVSHTSIAPESFQEQRQLLLDERRRLQEAKAFVENQRLSLEERRAQLKAARRHWKSDVMNAKAQGVLATSKKGMLLQKVHKVLDKQTVGLQHDDNLLKDSEHWLKTKEHRLVKLEQQLDEHERSRQGLHEVSMASVDTTALLTGFFKPQSAKPSLPAEAEPRPKIGHTTKNDEPTVPAAAAAARSISPMLSKALERIERRLDKVALLVAGPKRSGAAEGPSSKRGRSSRSSSRGRHVDFVPTAFADPWTEIAAVS